MNHYETLFILHPDVGEQQRKDNIERMRRLVEGMGGNSLQVEEWGLRDLAYLIRKQSRGYYVRAEYVAAPEVVKELERTMKLTDDVLRFVSVRLPKTVKTSTPAPRTAETPAAEAAAE